MKAKYDLINWCSKNFVWIVLVKNIWKSLSSWPCLQLCSIDLSGLGLSGFLQLYNLVPLVHLLTNWCFKPHKHWELNVMKTACREGTFDPSKLQHLVTDWRRNFSYSYTLYSARNKCFIYLFHVVKCRKFYKFCFSCVNVKKKYKKNLMPKFQIGITTEGILIFNQKLCIVHTFKW